MPVPASSGVAQDSRYEAVPKSRQAKLSRVDQSPARRFPRGLNTSVPNVARMYDYYLGGHFR